MTRISVKQLRQLMDMPEHVRNLTVIAHVDHGKTTLTDSLLGAAGIMSMDNAGKERLTDTRQDEQERGITIKSTGISLFYQIPDNFLTKYSHSVSCRDFLINLIDSPGHVDFSSEVTAALRITDGALVVVDCVDGVCVQTRTVLHQALGDRIKSVLCLNKLDRCFIELDTDGEDAYMRFARTIDTTNDVLLSFADEFIGQTKLLPRSGGVCFAAGLHGWAFTLYTFSRLYATRMKLDMNRTTQRLWGENFFDSKLKR
jgi:elongation factor 2